MVEGPTDLTGQTFTEARTCGGSVPTKPRYRCATDPDTVTLPDTPVRSRVPARAMQALCRSGQGAWTNAAWPKIRKNPRFRKLFHEFNMINNHHVFVIATSPAKKPNDFRNVTFVNDN